MITRLEEIVSAAVARGRKRLAVAYGQDTHTIEAVYNAWKEGICDATLYGDKATIEAACAELNIDPNIFNIVHEPSDVNCVRMAVAAVAAGDADVLMKGLVSTDKYMRG
ncbi:MAG: phosphate butyryltransferase, partial [Alistipes sp.]|nr:phosphate butyryltransferase [Alistipes sp.]